MSLPVPKFNWTIMVTIVYLYVLFGGAVFVMMILTKIPCAPTERCADEGIVARLDEHSGRYIGILERSIVLTLVLQHSLEAVAFILAAKSVAGYVELDKKMSAEYYLVGTLASLPVAALGGLALQTLAPLFLFK